MSLWTGKPARCYRWQIVLIQISANFAWHKFGRSCGIHIRSARPAIRELSSLFLNLSQKSVDRDPKEHHATEQSSYMIHNYHPLSWPEPLPDFAGSPIRQMPLIG